VHIIGLYHNSKSEDLFHSGKSRLSVLSSGPGGLYYFPINTLNYSVKEIK